MPLADSSDSSQISKALLPYANSSQCQTPPADLGKVQVSWLSQVEHKPLYWDSFRVTSTFCFCLTPLVGLPDPHSNRPAGPAAAARLSLSPSNSSQNSTG